MAQFVTLDELTRFKNELKSYSLLEEASRSKTNKTVFLSHSSKDKEYLPAVISILQNHGGKVYVDSQDDRLPNNPNRETADILRDTVKTCRRFVLFVTTNSNDSKWIPWELGLADGEKGSYSVALFPSSVTSYDQRWAEVEYLGLYRRIVWGKIQGEMDENGWIVLDHEKNSAVKLRKWLSGIY